MAAADTHPVAEWRLTATELDAASIDPAAHLSMTEVCNRTGLRQVSLQYAINRTGELRRNKPLAHLVRPRFRVGETPYWAPEQVDAYHTAFSAQVRNQRAEWDTLPEVTVEEAARRRLLSLRSIAEITAVALTTLHRWSGSPDFPDPVARRSSAGPNPHVLREWHAVRDWLRSRDPDRLIPDEPPPIE